MTDTRRIEYRFLHWGPFVCNYTLTSEEVEAFRSLEGGEDYRNNLAGHLENEKALDKEKVSEKLSKESQEKEEQLISKDIE